MSLHIIKPGILDTVQDLGRYGYQHLGINPNGAMDRFSAQLANALLGKALGAPVIEMHFPASHILFEQETILCIAGANFLPVLNGKPIPVHHPVMVSKGCVLEYKKIVSGARCYLSVLNEWHIDPWLHSFSTNIKAAAGGYKGRALQKGDVVHYKNEYRLSHHLRGEVFKVLPWKANGMEDYAPGEIEYITGSEWHWLTEEAKHIFSSEAFYISSDADRMGYRLKGKKLAVKEQGILLSSGVSFGTVQLLPDGQLILLMADHQTTGGYPIIAHIISAQLPVVAQRKPNEILKFKLTDLQTAEQKIYEQQKKLQNLRNACTFKMENLLNVVL